MRSKPDQRMKEDLDLFLLALIQQGITTAYRMQTAAGISQGSSLQVLKRLLERKFIRMSEEGPRRRDGVLAHSCRRKMAYPWLCSSSRRRTDRRLRFHFAQSAARCIHRERPEEGESVASSRRGSAPFTGCGDARRTLGDSGHGPTISAAKGDSSGRDFEHRSRCSETGDGGAGPQVEAQRLVLILIRAPGCSKRLTRPFRTLLRGTPRVRRTLVSFYGVWCSLSISGSSFKMRSSESQCTVLI